MILIATPTRDQMYAGFTVDLVNLVSFCKTGFMVTQGTILPNLRNLLAGKAVENDYSHVLFIDSDMRFPCNTVDRLLAHDVGIVGANCKQRTQDEWTARKEGKFITSENKTGLEEVDTIGMGVTLIKTDILTSLREPWFSTPYDQESRKHIGEDVYFCQMAKARGFSIWIDHDLSQEVRHAGLVEFGIKS